MPPVALSHSQLSIHALFLLPFQSQLVFSSPGNSRKFYLLLSIISPRSRDMEELWFLFPRSILPGRLGQRTQVLLEGDLSCRTNSKQAELSRSRPINYCVSVLNISLRLVAPLCPCYTPALVSLTFLSNFVFLTAARQLWIL